MPKSQPKFRAIIFDIDNVLVDTRRSYLEAIRWCIDIFLTHGKIPHFVAGPKARTPHLLTANDVNHFKLLGGFNDDWDCCYGLLVYLMHLPVKSRTIPSLKEAKDIDGFVKKIHNRPLGVNGIVKLLGRHPAIKIEQIERIFQEIYLGPDLFHKREQKFPAYWKKRGLINMEKPIFPKETLEKLKAAGIKLGIATGRPRFEAEFALKNFDILHLFDAMTTMDEVYEAEQKLGRSLRKPNPYSLIETAKKLGEKHNLLYVGDLPDDMLAAKHAKPHAEFQCAGFPWFASDPEAALKEFHKIHPDFILKKARQILKLAGLK